MNVNDAKRLGRKLLDEHGLHDWTFGFDNAKKRFGHCVYNKKSITTSFYLTVLNDETEVHDMILHEIAHALAGYEAAHGPVWKAMARSIGASDSRTYDDVRVKTPPARWTAICDGCGREAKRYRKPKNLSSCGKCDKRFNPDYLLRWKDNNERN